jgi:glycosyltransferase involved in cell wall biosynthesis
VKASICIATYDRPEVLDKVLKSIFDQRTTFDFEVIVVDDGGASAIGLCRKYPIRYARIDREPKYRNPSVARNLAYKMATGDVLICQSDDVVHQGDDAIQRLVSDLHEGEFLIATVWNVNEQGEVVGLREWPRITQLTGPLNRRPLLFLGSVWREDMYAVGGNDEDFTSPGREDDWLAQCLINGRHLIPRYVSVVGHHLDHSRPANLMSDYRHSAQVHQRKAVAAQTGLAPWRGGDPWPYVPLPPASSAASLPAAYWLGW